MSYTLSPLVVQEILRTFCGTYDVDLQGGRVRLLGRSLPGKAVCAILPDAGDGVLRLVYDANKPNAFAHAQAMVREWWLSDLEPIVFPDGSVELINRPCPELEPGPVCIAIIPTPR